MELGFDGGNRYARVGGSEALAEDWDEVLRIICREPVRVGDDGRGVRGRPRRGIVPAERKVGREHSGNGDDVGDGLVDLARRGDAPERCPFAIYDGGGHDA